jgi:hypothetical protein
VAADVGVYGEGRSPLEIYKTGIITVAYLNVYMCFTTGGGVGVDPNRIFEKPLTCIVLLR